MLNLARKLKEFIFTDNESTAADTGYDTQENVNNDTKIFEKRQRQRRDFSEQDSTIIRESLQRKKVSLKIMTNGQNKKEIVLDSIETNIGRQKSNEIVLKDKSVSRVHAQLINKRYYYKIRDLNSTNGSYVNGELIKEQRLADGDEIRLGKTILKFSLKS